MSDLPGQIAREAKSLQVGLKELLKTHDVLDKEIEIHRKNLRRQYLRLLFVHPYAKESREAETHLWMQTSYSLIAIYKQRIGSLDRAIQNPPRQPQQNAQPQRVVEYRKLLQRFRQFLSEEERFWTQLIVRFRRNFAVDAAQPALNVLQITAEEEAPPPGTDAATGTRRNLNQFPPESDTPEATPPATTVSQRESRLAILSKSLVCLGDIARYKEQYNESGGRPRAGHEDGPPAVAAGKSRSGKRGGAPPAATPMLLPRLRDYSRARACYEQARSLVPHDGNPSHQLAILCSYEKDMFNSLTHYYRALCVRQPYDTASENMGTVLSRALDMWKARRAKREEEAQTDPDSIAPRLRVEGIKEKVIVLHALWRVDANDEEGLTEKTLQDFDTLVSERILPLDHISKVIILSQGALWKHRMVRQPTTGERKVRSPSTENRIASHLLDLHRIILRISARELSELSPEDAAHKDLAQRIPAVFRRTIPALRMAGKWIRANTRYLAQAAGVTPEYARSRGRGRDGKQTSHSKEKTTPPISINGLEAFWHEYVNFMNILTTTFPSDQLPQMTFPLEEDTDMVGFLPLRKYMFVDGKTPVPYAGSVVRPDLRGMAPLKDATLGLHPNEEQLMRISDIIVDAHAVVEDENTPVASVDGRFEYRKPTAAPRTDPTSNGLHRASHATVHATALQAEPEVAGQGYDSDDDNMTVATRTDDDLVEDAVQHVLDAFEAEDDDDEIVWNLTPIRSPLQGPSTRGLTTPPRLSPTSPQSPRSPPYSPHRDIPLSPPQISEQILPVAPPAPPASTGLTAAELLSNMRGPQRLRPIAETTPMHHVRMPSAPTAPLSFGPNGPVQSIWSDVGTGHSRQYSAGAQPSGSSLLSGSPFVSSTPHTPVQQNPIGYAPASWSNTQPSQASSNGYLSSQTTMYSSPPSTIPFNPAPAHNLTTGHTRVPSESAVLPRNQLYQSQPTHHRFDSLRSHLPIGDQVNVPNRGLNYLPPSVYTDTIYSASPGAAYTPRDTRDQFGHPIQQSRGMNVDRTFTAPFMTSSSIWSHPG